MKNVSAEVKQQEQLTDKQVESQSLLSQNYIRDESKTIEQLLKETIATTGENIRVGRFARFELGR